MDPAFLGNPQFPDAPTRIYLDIEGDPERGFCYLVGVIVQAGEAEKRHTFWADSPAEEGRLLGQFLDLVRQYPDAWVYAYGAYEAAFLRRARQAAGRQGAAGRTRPPSRPRLSG